MATFLLTWNPKKFEWTDFDVWVRDVTSRRRVRSQWSCGNNLGVHAGDRVFLLRQGIAGRGLIGSGVVTRGSQLGSHWKFKNKEGVHIRFDWDYLSASPVISRTELDQKRFQGFHWDPQSSGHQVREPVATEIEKEWAKRTGTCVPTNAIEETSYRWEGQVYRLTVNVYERDPAARRKCLEHYGNECSVCGKDIAKQFGLKDQRIIHVHHLMPLSQIGRSYRVDPINDLRPICPNCHTVIHSRTPCYTVSEMKRMLKL